MKMPKLTIYQIVIEALTILLVLACIIGTLVCYKSMPDSIPSHFNSAGEVDGYSGKGSVFAILATTVGMYILMTLCLFFPNAVSKPNTLTPLDPRFTPLITRETISLLIECTFLTVALFAYILLFMLLAKQMIVWPVWLICGVMTVSIILRCVRLSRYKLR